MNILNVMIWLIPLVIFQFFIYIFIYLSKTIFEDKKPTLLMILIVLIPFLTIDVLGNILEKIGKKIMFEKWFFKR